MSILAQLFPRYAKNAQVLREAVNAIGAECEKWNYDELDRAAEEQPLMERPIDGGTAQFNIDCWEKKRNGDLFICIDADGLPTLMGVKPSYVFAKRIDGTVYYP